MKNKPPRLAPLSPAQFNQRQRELVGDWSAMNFARVAVRHPSLYEVFLPYLARLIRESSLPPRDREILVIRVLAIAQEEYESAHHRHIAITAGLDETEIEAIRKGGQTLSAPEQLLIRAADELVQNQTLEDSTWDGLAGQYDEVQLMEIVYLVGCYCTMAMLTKTFEIAIEPDAETAFSGLRDYT